MNTPVIKTLFCSWYGEMEDRRKKEVRNGWGRWGQNMAGQPVKKETLRVRDGIVVWRQVSEY